MSWISPRVKHATSLRSLLGTCSRTATSLKKFGPSLICRLIKLGSIIGISWIFCGTCSSPSTSTPRLSSLPSRRHGASGFVKTKLSLELRPTKFKEATDNRWIPPTFPWHKINMDVAIFPQLGMIGVGVIIRDHEGSVVYGMSKCIPLPLGPLEAEAKAMDEATLFSRDFGVRDIIFELESTDAAGRVPHLRPTRLPACQCCVCVFFFFFFLGFTPTRLDSRRLGLIHANAAQFMSNQLRFMPNRADSAIIGPYQPVTDTAEIGLEYGRKSRNYHLRGIVMCFLPSSFLFCESRHSKLFFKNILIVKIYRKYK